MTRGGILADVGEGLNRVFLADGRGGDRYLRVTFHPDTDTVVFSHWHGDVCVASTPVSLAEAAKLIELLARASGQATKSA